MKCVKCNKSIDDEDLFCGYCGINQEKYKKYLEKVNNKVHKERDREYNIKIKNAQNNLNKLKSSREMEIQRINSSRWQTIGNYRFAFNMTEGKVKINGETYSFSDIKGAEIVTKDSVRTITNTTSTTTGKSKKHASLGGALAGAIVTYPVSARIGALVGGTTLGKKTKKEQTNTVTNSNEIPTCYHIAVSVNLNGFNTEITLLSRTVDQTNPIYNNIMNNAQLIVDKLRKLSQTPVPNTFTHPEEEQIVLNIDREIEKAKEQLQVIINDKPNYEIPERYLK